MKFAKTQTQARVDHTIVLSLYVCPAEHCQACPRQAACTRTPEKGRSVSRMENEELLDALRERMQTPDAKKLYKLRSRTVELNYADLKEHRGMRRFHCRGPHRVSAEIGSATEEVGTSKIASTLSLSYQLRAMLTPTSGLF